MIQQSEFIAFYHFLERIGLLKPQFGATFLEGLCAIQYDVHT